MLIQHICQAMSEIAPLGLAEQWDNVGLLLGDRTAPANRVMTCLTVTPAVVSEAEQERVDLLIAHHPLPFKPLAKINTDSAAGEMVWRLCRAGVALYSAHTAYDSAAGGINEQWCDALGLASIAPLIAPSPSLTAAPLGAGRYGDLPEPRPARDVLAAAAEFSRATQPRLVGDPAGMVRRIGVACGSGGSFVAAARRVGCDLLLSGEATFHTCLEAENTGLSLALLGHYASERFAMESLAQRLQSLSEPVKDNANSATEAKFLVWASRQERDVVFRPDFAAAVGPITVDPISQNP